jgi:hypothetical protein
VTEAERRFGPRSAEAEAGQPLDIHEGSTQIKRVTVFSLVDPVEPPDDFSRSVVPAQKHLVAVDIELCAGPAGDQDVADVIAFRLVTPAAEEVNIGSYYRKAPDLMDVHALGVNQCGRGFLTFEIADDTKPSLLRYEPFPGHRYEWSL